MLKNSSSFTGVTRLTCQCGIGLFALAALHDCVMRSNAGGLNAPGMGMTLCSIVIAAILFFYAMQYWRAGNYNDKELGAILFLLIPEIFIWYAFHNPSKSTIFFYFNIPLWSALTIWCIARPHTTKVHKRLLTLFFLKGAALAMFSIGMLRAPWFTGDIHIIPRILIMFIPVLVATFYQMFALGVMWRLREKQGL